MVKLFNVVLVCALFLMLFPVNTPASAAVTASITPSISPEGNDYATQVLKNAWDMNQYKDISKYLNTSGVSVNLGNISVQNGIFSARTNNTDGYFFPLFPGYPGGYNPGGYGENNPISSSKYHCLTMRARIDTSATDDEIRIFWFADNRLTGGPFGVSTNSIKPVVPAQWAIYQYDLNTNFDSTNSNAPWTSRSTWQAIRIDPTRKSGINFAIDWVRLTDCEPRTVTVNYSSPSGGGEIWMGRSPNAFETKLVDVSAGSTSSPPIRVEGWEAGTYYIGVKSKSSGSTQWSQFSITEAPRVEIHKPSFTSGEGFSWQMNSSADLVFGPDKTSCVGYSFSSGLLNLTTSSPATIGGGCTASGYSDPKLFLTMPAASFSPAEYRYLSYRMRTDGAYQDINKGWVARWLWYYQNGGLCIGVTYGISIDVDWETYALDMHNPAIGTPNYTEYCGKEAWSAHAINYLRFDPNENDTAAPITQAVDWIGLHRMDRVQKGSQFPVVISPSQPASGLTLKFFYTPSLSQLPGTAMTIIQPSQGSIQPATGRNKVYLPVLKSGGSSIIPDGLKYMWDTSNVARGTYYVCVQSQDSASNQSLDCSEAPVQVY